MRATRKTFRSEFGNAAKSWLHRGAAQKVGFMVTPMPSAETKAWIVAHDEAVYPILLDAGMVKARKK